MDKISSRAPFFIVGSGRCGSTLLRVILASHSRIAIPPETWYLLPLLEAFSPTAPLSVEQADAAVQIITQHYRWPDMNLDRKEFQREVADLKTPHLRDIVEIMYAKTLLRENKIRWGDKTPGYMKILPQLALMFPDALFIHLFRDGRDVAKSFQAQHWFGPSLYENCIEWNKALNYGATWMRSRFADKILEVCYETLVLETEDTVREVCEFLGERFESEMLSWQERIRHLVPQREAHIHEKLNRKPCAVDVYRWRREMTRTEMFVAECVMGKHLAARGYERLYQGAKWAPVFVLVRWCLCLSSPLLVLQRRMFRFLRRMVAGRTAIRGQRKYS